jgi:hypothetical protein
MSVFKFFRNSTPKPPAPAPTPAPAHAEGAFHDSIPAPIGVKRELIKAAFHDTLHHHGIPHEWLACEVVTVAPTAGEETLQIQLVLMQWQETFLRYGLALEQLLRREIDRLDTAPEHARYQIVWRISPDCGCHFKVMPPARIWHAQTAADVPSPDAPDPMDRRKALRSDPDDDYQPTQLTRL